MLYAAIVGIILTEALTELLVKSEIFQPVRNFVFFKSQEPIYNFIGKVLSCGYCCSVWVAAALTFIFTVLGFIELFGFWLLDFFVITLVLHRASNYLHGVSDRYFDTRYDNRYTKLGE